MQKNTKILLLIFIFFTLILLGLIYFRQNQFFLLQKGSIIDSKYSPSTLSGANQVENSKIDQKEYGPDSLATYIQKNSTLHELFQDKPLDSEFCFNQDLENNQSDLRCFIPSQVLNAGENFVTQLQDLEKYKRDDSIRTQSLEELPRSEQIFNLLHLFDTDNYQTTKTNLEGKKMTATAEAEELKALAYLYALEGDYAKSESIQAESCAKFHTQCQADVALTLQGTVTDQNGKPLEAVLIEILNHPNQNTQTDAKGNYELQTSAFNLDKIRIKASKIGYSDGVIPLNILGTNNQQTHSNLNFILNTPAKIVTINNATKTFTGEGVQIENESFVIQTEWNQYTIPFNSLVHKDKTPYLGEVTVYLFEFNKASKIDNLLQNDVFAEIVGYAGNLMKTFGMPYILFVTPEGEKIHVLKSNPMILESQIMEMEALRTNQDKIYEPLTESDLTFLLEQSNTLGGYPLDLKYLTDPAHLLVRFPAFWVFDQNVGIWENIGIKLLNVGGLIESQFYTLNDLK